MKKLLPTLILVLVWSTLALAQDVQPTPTPDPDETDVVRISTNLIQLDVTVTDKKGKVISDLRPDEIEIYENGKLQKATNFSFVSNTRSATPSKTERVDNAVVPPPIAPKPGEVRRTVALIVDDLSLSFSSSYWVKRALKKFVLEQMQEGDLVAIIRTGTGIGALQQFTTDKRQLLAAVEKLHFNMSGSARLSVFNPIEPTLKQELNGTRTQQGGTRDFSDDIESEREFENDVNNFTESIFASGTLGAVNYVIRGIKDLPGRKSVLLISDGFKTVKRDKRGMPTSNRIFDLLRSLTDLANRASVVVNTLDPRGL